MNVPLVVGRGNCMFPASRDGSLLCLQPARFRDLQCGDVVVVRHSPERRSSHRLVRKFRRNGTDFILTKPDWRLLHDTPHSSCDIEGRVCAVWDGRWKNAGRGLPAVLSRAGFLAGVVLERLFSRRGALQLERLFVALRWKLLPRTLLPAGPPIFP